MLIAVTGASGYVGSALRRAIVERGDRWRGLSRRPAEDAAAGSWVKGDLADAAALDRLVRGADAVVHAAAWVHRDARDPASRAACFAANLGGTERLIAAMERTEARLPLVFVSSTAVYGEAFADVTEAAPCRPAGAYGESKLAAERAVLGLAATRPVVAIRPAMVYGPAAPGNIARLAGLARRGFAPLVSGGLNRKSLVHVDDLAVALLAAVDRAAACSGAILNAASEPAPTVREIAEALAAGPGRRLAWIPVPGPVWGVLAALGRQPARLSGGRAPDLGRALEVFAATNTVAAGEIRRRLGVTFRDAATGLRESMKTPGVPVR